MSLTLQKAGLWKRISAFLFDIILTVTIAVGFSVAVSAMFDYNGQVARLNDIYTAYEQEYGVDFDISKEDYEKLTDEQKANLDAANQAFLQDEGLIEIYDVLFYMTLAIVSISAFTAILLWQFLIPLFFGNGQTLGKKIFGTCVIRTNFTKAANPVLFIRAMVGVFAIETMFPILMFIMVVFGFLGSAGIIALLLFYALQIFVMCYTQTNSAIHDLLTDTVVVDFASQMIFETEEERIAYEKEAEQETVLNSSN